LISQDLSKEVAAAGVNAPSHISSVLILEEEHKMAYVTSWERIARKEGDV